MTCRRSLVALLAIGLGLAGCGKPGDSDNTLTALDNQLFDSAGVNRPHAGKPADSPARVPAGDECPAGGRSGSCRAAAMVHAPGCGNNFALGLVWATRLPAGLELYPGAKVIEAAGSDEGDCHMRIISYVSDASPKELVDWYQAASKAGYDTEHVHNGREEVVAGTREPQGDAFHVTIAPDAAGSTADLIVNHGT
jgi:hypothetical protein